MLVKVTQDATGIEFVNPTGFLTSEDIAWKVYPETSDLPSATDYHGMFAHVHGGGGAAYMAHGGAWHKIWPNDTEAGSTSFTGLSGTPGNFVANKFLKVTSDGTGIRILRHRFSLTVKLHLRASSELREILQRISFLKLPATALGLSMQI